MSAKTPEAICPLFQRCMAEGDLDGVLSVYDEEAVLLDQAAEVTEGRQNLRERFAPLVAMKPLFEFDVKQVVQADGTWRWLIGDPFTVAREVGPPAGV